MWGWRVDLGSRIFANYSILNVIELIEFCKTFKEYLWESKFFKTESSYLEDIIRVWSNISENGLELSFNLLYLASLIFLEIGKVQEFGFVNVYKEVVSCLLDDIFVIIIQWEFN